MDNKPIVFFASDENPFYSDFAPYVIDAWQSFGFEVHYSVINKDNCFVDPQIIPFGNQAQICRVLLPTLFKDRLCLTSDIDMLPLSNKYFQNSLIEIKNEKSTILSLSADAYQSNSNKFYKRHPICYIAGFGSAFSQVTGVTKKEQIADCMIKWWNTGNGWNTDEICFSTDLYKAVALEKVILLERNRGWTNGMANDRIDRDNWTYDPIRLKNNEYIDSHMLRPLNKYKEYIKPLFDSLKLKN